MSLKGDRSRYGSLAACLHWVSAVAVLAMLPLGFVAAHAYDPARKADLLRLHLPLGLLILMLTLVRVAWWLFDVRPARPVGQPHWQDQAARGTHVLLYAAILLLCGSGVGLVATSGAASAIFSGPAIGLPAFPAFAPFRPHVAGAIILAGLLVLHLSAAAYHQFWRRDRLLTRMRVGRQEAVR